MAEKRRHFEIPNERVRRARVEVRGFAKKVSRPNFSAHGDFLRERTAAVAQFAAAAADAGAAESLFFQVRTPVENPVRSERQRLQQAGLEVVALSALDPSSATVKLSKRDLPALEARLERYARSEKNTGKSYLAVIEDIVPVPSEEKIALELASDDDSPTQCLLVFYASLSDKERAGVLFAVRSFMSRTGLALGSERRLRNGVTLVEAVLRPSEARQVGAAFSTLRQVVPNHVFVVPDGRRISQVAAGVAVDPPRLLTSVAVVDTGVSSRCIPVSSSVHVTIPELPSGAVRAEEQHGTFVSSRILFGDDLEAGLRAGVLTPICRIVDVPVFGFDAGGGWVPVNEGHIAEALDRVLPRLENHTRVVNLSLGTNTPVADGHMSVIGQVLDFHARERNLLVVTTAGNIRDPRLLATYPSSLMHPMCRIDAPGDSLLSLTVGSLAKFSEAGALSQPRTHSGFSRRGPGPFGGLKPDLVAHGGNCLPDGNTSARIGVHGLGADGASWECDCGTSFAAPLVSRMAATLFDHYNQPHANLVRALLLHFTRPVGAPSIAVSPEHLVGTGEPDVEAACWAASHSATFLHSGTLSAAEHTLLPFHVPACLAAGAGGRLSIRVTVVIDPPVAPDNQLEYSQCRLSVALRKPSDIGHRSVSVASDALEADRWSPVTKLERTFQRSYEVGEWELQLRLWTRDLPGDFVQSFSAIIEVIDTTGTQPVLDAVEAEAGTSYTLVRSREAA